MGLDAPLLPKSFAERGEEGYWQLIFFFNVFVACVSFSIVMPSLWLYLDKLGASEAFYAAVVAIYSVGEAIGSVTLGSLSNRAGTKRTLILCILLSASGALMYALADFYHRTISAQAAPAVVLLGRLFQGIGSGGQQAVEQAYLSIAAPSEQRTELTGRLSTFACLGFIFGPALGAAVSQLPSFGVGELHFDAFTMQGWSMAFGNLMMFVVTSQFNERKRSEELTDFAPDAKVGSKPEAEALDNYYGILACIAFFFVHFNGFAVQETITTPLVQDWFGWDVFSANLLFVASGMMNLVCAVVLAFVSAPRDASKGYMQARVEDRKLLFTSLGLAGLGWLLLIPAGKPNLTQFLIAYTLITIAFPFGRGVCLSMVGKLLGDAPQGGWMGVMFALGAVARILGPFWAVHGYFAIGPFAVFGSTCAIFAMSLVSTIFFWPKLVPASAVQVEKSQNIYDAIDMSTPTMSPHLPRYHVVANISPRRIFE